MGRPFLAAIFFGACFFAGSFAHAQHDLIRRVVVFPLKVDATYNEQAVDIWWNLRSRLTSNKRFLVASKNFMESKGVFQPRGVLEPADAIILGRLLDAQGLITASLDGNVISMQAYGGRQGLLLWQKKLELHPAVPISKQLPDACDKLILDFIASVPYQGRVIVDSLVGRAVFHQGDRDRVKVDVGEGLHVQVGDVVQLVHVKPKSVEALFSSADIQVYAEGRVVEVNKQILTVELEKVSDISQVREDSLVRLPTELKRLQDTYVLGGSDLGRMEVGRVKDPNALTASEKEKKPLVTAVAFLANVAVMLLVAF